MNKTTILTSALLGLLVTSVQARDVQPFNADWQYKKGTLMTWGVYPDIMMPRPDTVVNLPHTFNANDFMSDGGYYRGKGSYTKEIEVPESWRGKRIFVKFEGAASVASVMVNFGHIAVHKGAYNAFAVELTDYLDYGRKNYVSVTCDNTQQFDVATQSGDFNILGGLYRDAWLELTDDVCISPLYYGSEGVLIHQKVTDQHADLSAEVHTLCKADGYKGCEIEFTVFDAEGNKVASTKTANIQNNRAWLNVGIDRPHLWNGMADPYLYKTVTILRRDGKEIDRVEDTIGLRYFWVDKDKGFFLNGKHLKLRGVSRHQDWAQYASALTNEQHDADLDIIQEMGVNSLRLAHYPQAHHMFYEADRRGMLVWEEIPFVSNYVKGQMDENLRFQLREMIIQNYNHPSIFCWGLFNEVPGYHDPITSELNDIAHELDPMRLTTAATCFEGSFNFISDLMGWNKYFGWYEGHIADFATFFDKWHAKYPDVKICISEYGAGAAFSQHVSQFVEEQDVRASARGRWHPMEKQTASHRQHLQMITERDYIWGSYVWNMFDFGSAMRREGDTNNLNDKGLVSHDRSRRKDAFYCYKANWNKVDKTVHLCSKDFTQRKEEVTDVIVFTTAPTAKLFVNGKQVGTAKTDAYATIEWKNVKLQKGENRVEVRTPHGNDSATWFVE
ncbi:MAG: DUF4982 domain-containing protein [Bacteroidales bacterium]|nr:DUF4982 domain-containing protein [Bacteroidales bacterium]